MKRHQLEHIIRASSAITGAREIVIVGSQAVLGQFPNAPEELLVSMEADVFSFRDSRDGDLIDGSIGEASPFHRTFGYYAHGVGEETACLPKGWKERLIRVQNENTGSGVGLCLEAHDLAVAKLIAGREKDITFLASMIKHQLINVGLVRERLGGVTMDAERKEMALFRLERLLRGE